MGRGPSSRDTEKLAICYFQVKRPNNHYLENLMRIRAFLHHALVYKCSRGELEVNVLMPYKSKRLPEGEVYMSPCDGGGRVKYRDK